MAKVIGVIPARYSSTRFPGKPLVDILGKPMIQWVYENAMGSKLLDFLIVATDDERIYNVVKSFGGNVIMTPSNIQTGTDRVAYVLNEFDADIVANIQGDEPLLTSEMIDRAIEPFLNSEKVDISTLAVKTNDVDLIFNPNVVKVVFDKDKIALYFSRSPIPFCCDAKNEKDWLKLGNFYKHIGLYVYSRESLLRFVSLRRSSLEEIEKLEQLRALENGFRIKVVISESDTIGVDTPEDVEKVVAFLKNKKMALKDER
jgi:3-deoxy-manno-octulosonate cytidylyltransferase (CMP-KDO synthetase)